MWRGAGILGGSVLERLKQKIGFAALAVMILSVPFAMAADGDMTGEELTALVGNGKKINLGGDGEGHSGSLDIKGDGTASWTVQVQGKTIDDGGTWTINQNRFCRKWRTFDAGAEVCEVWRKIGDSRVVVLVDGKKIGLNWW